MAWMELSPINIYRDCVHGENLLNPEGDFLKIDMSNEDDMKKILVEKICKKCEFYSDDDVDLECYAFKLSRKMVEEGKINLDDL
jgi:hypothetical protein